MKKDRLINFGGHSGGGALGECPAAVAKRAYESPEVTVVSFKMERGFTASNPSLSSETRSFGGNAWNDDPTQSVGESRSFGNDVWQQ